MSGRFLHDQVDGWNPVKFAIEFTRKLRVHNGIAHIPSIRTSLSVPKFLAARYFRTHLLTPKDYIEAAVLNTVPEDKEIAEQVAHEILFPKAEEIKKEIQKEVVIEDELDPMAGIMSDMSSLDIDFDNLESFNDLLDSEDSGMGAFELFDQLYSSADEKERSLAELTLAFGGPAELESWGITTIPKVEEYLKEMLSARIGELKPDDLYHGCRIGLAEMLQQDAKMPWELSGAFAGAGNDEALSAHLEDLLENSSSVELGKTIRFLMPHKERLGDRLDDFTNRALSQAHDFSDFGEIVSGLGEWIDPPDSLVETSAKENIKRALHSASTLKDQFGVAIDESLFNFWLKDLNVPPDLEQLADVAVDCKKWHELVESAFDDHVQWLRGRISQRTVDMDEILPPVNRDLYHCVSIADQLTRTTISKGQEIAEKLATEAMLLINLKDHFIPMLDEFLDHGIIPHDTNLVIEAGKSLGVDVDEILDRIGNFTEQLSQMILENIHNAGRYKHLVTKISYLDDDLAKELTEYACNQQNMEAMAAMLALHIQIATENAPEDFVMKSLCYKGIGGGANLLKQWFTHRENLGSELKSKIKAIAKAALIELSIDWMSKGSGSTDTGLIPQNQVKPFMSGDDIDNLDIESTLDSIISSGKKLESITEDELFVYDTSKGRAGLGVLIDISGSMDGEDLAVCAIAVVMLLGKVRSEEIAIAVFESDTHVIKCFNDESDLDVVADQILDLAATGGTRVDAALHWVSDEFISIPEAEFRMLFLLSDFCFFEEEKELFKLGGELADQGVVFLGASHGHICKNNLNTLKKAMGGYTTNLKSIQKLPTILLETLRQIGEEQM